jgi:hypothetical protein
MMMKDFLLLEQENGHSLWLGKGGLYTLTQTETGWAVHYTFGSPFPSEEKIFLSEDQALQDICDADTESRRKWENLLSN